MTDLNDFNNAAFHLIDSYKINGNPKPLADAVRNGDTDATGSMVRSFVADIIEGKEKLDKRKAISANKTQRDWEIIFKVYLYHYGAKVPIYERVNENNCCCFIEDEYQLKANTVYKEIWKKREDNFLWKSISLIINDTSLGKKSHYRMVFLYNRGQAPKTYAEFNEITDEIESLPEQQIEKLRDKAEEEIWDENRIERKKERNKQLKKHAEANNLNFDEVLEDFCIANGCEI